VLVTVTRAVSECDTPCVCFAATGVNMRIAASDRSSNVRTRKHSICLCTLLQLKVGARAVSNQVGRDSCLLQEKVLEYHHYYHYFYYCYLLPRVSARLHKLQLLHAVQRMQQLQ
jgi:hypothetical protein